MAALTARAALELDTGLVLISIDGVGACDHIARKAMFEAMDELPQAREMIPFLLNLYGQESTLFVSDVDSDDIFEVTQGG